MNKEFKRMVKLAGLNEIKVTPNIKFKTNEQLAEYLDQNSIYKKQLINAITNSPKFNVAQNPDFRDVIQGWIDNPTEMFTAFNIEDEVMITDGDDNNIFISLKPLSDKYAFEINLPPNKFYCLYI
jgi:hypothetical protein